MIKRCVKMHLISSTYNTAIFEFKNKEIRQVLNHIQKEEQEHGEKNYNYMNQHNMYN
ncbi:spore coat protein [Paraclostridium sordellii]|uniref:spore coat protein n=1 Tax=Paraclostridium sordellii TaxID=1505 RepID=UPI002F3E22B3